MPVAVLKTVLLLSLANVFMTFAWYAHLKNLSDKPWYIGALLSWGIALIEYLFQVPANRIGLLCCRWRNSRYCRKSLPCACFCHLPCFTCINR